MSNYVTFVRNGDTNGAPEGSEKWEKVLTPPLSRVFCNAMGRFVSETIFTARTIFNLLPAASATAGKDDLMFTLGTGTEVIARSSKGGVNVKTQSTTPAASDNALLVPATSSNMIVPLTAVSQPGFRARIRVTTISDATSDTTLVTSATTVFAGFNETLTNVDPTTDAGDGAGFLYNPNPGVGGSPVALTTATGLAAATRLNWILHQKVAGADTFIDSTVPVVAGRDYEFHIKYGEDLIPLYYIDGVLRGTGVAGTTGHSFGAILGIQIMNTTPAAQLDFDCRYVAVERNIG